MKRYFVTSSGTEIGKTLVTTSLCYQLRKAGHKVHGLKPVISGWGSELGTDTDEILESLNLPVTEENIDKVSHYRFLAPLSPDIAAKKEGKKIDFDKVVSFCNSFDGYDHLFIEGIGGVMVPLTENKTILDLISVLKAPAIVVVGSYLGSISHTLTTIEALRSKNIEINSLIISQSLEDSVDIDDMVMTLKNFIDEKIVKLPRMDLTDKKWESTPNLLKDLEIG